MKKEIRKNGFTLIELVIYLGITSIILVSITYLTLTLLLGQAKNFVGSELNYNLQYLSNYLTRDIKRANKIDSLSTTTLSLSQQSDTVVYRFDRDNLELWRQYNSNPPVKMNTDYIKINGTFFEKSFANKSKNVEVYLELIEFKNEGGLQEFTATTSSVFNVELRGKK